MQEWDAPAPLSQGAGPTSYRFLRVAERFHTGETKGVFLKGHSGGKGGTGGMGVFPATKHETVEASLGGHGGHADTWGSLRGRSDDRVRGHRD